ncbi:MAG: hypothetical protein HY744_29960 [Deltaproteobacteria bacterium]|nr:hypothetical protein [Deltaproteobacteria bacterium]
MRMMSNSTWLRALRRALAAPDELPLEAWLEEAACAGVTCAADPLAPALAPASRLAAQLGALGLSAGARGATVLELALLVDALSPEAPPDARAALRVRRALLRASGSPLDHAAALLDDSGRLHLALLGRPACAALVREAAIRRVGPNAGSLLGELEARIGRLQMAGLAVLARAPAPVRMLAERIERAGTLGRRGLALGGGCRAAWDINRSGLLGRAKLVGDLFGPLVALEAAAQAGLDVCAPLREVAARRAGDGLRYFHDFPAMPHDTDDAAALLLAARRCGGAGVVPKDLLHQARRVLRAATGPGGGIHTWVALPDDDATAAPERWLGEHCAGVAGRVLWAMTGRAAARSGKRLAQSAAWLAGQADADGGFSGVFYPSRIVTTGLVVQGLGAARCWLPPEAEAALSRALAWLGAAQAADGSFGAGALETASAVRALAQCSALDAATAGEAAAFLVRSQRWDGCWPPDDHYLTPYPSRTVGPVGSACVSTALCLCALAAARTATSAGFARNPMVEPMRPREPSAPTPAATPRGRSAL